MPEEEKKDQKPLGKVDAEEPLPETSQYHEGDAEKLPDENLAEESVQQIAEATEELSKTPPMQAYDEGMKDLQRTMDDVADSAAASLTTDDHTHSDTVQLPVLGEITVPGGIYTVVFGVLGALTVLEVLFAELLKNNDALLPLKVGILLGIGVAKAALVVIFYMHLREDNRLFAVALLMPLLIVMLSILYLLAVPPTGYSL